MEFMDFYSSIFDEDNESINTSTKNTEFFNQTSEHIFKKGQLTETIANNGTADGKVSYGETGFGFMDFYSSIFDEGNGKVDLALESDETLANEGIKLLREKTGLTYMQISDLLDEYNGNIDLALESVEYFAKYLSGVTLANESINTSIKNAGVYNQLAENLSKYNTNRGGANFKGFVFEDMHAANATVNGQLTEVIANNGIADFKIISPDGKVSYGQAKVNCKTSSIDWSAYKDQTIVIDKGNQTLINRAKKAGCNVIESNISEKEAQALAKSMKLESKITGKTNATIVPKMHYSGQIAKQCHNSGINAAKNGAAFGSGFSIGSNLVELIDGEKELGEVAVDIAKDTVVAAGTSYVVGAATTAIASTSVGATAIGVATTATTAVTGAITSTAAGAAAATAVTGAATAVTGAITSTAVGAAIAGTAVGTAAIAAAPVVAAGAVIGGVFTLGKKIFGK
ncbi:TPA: hypothetical protein ACSRFI_004076 [Clostridioides difficile]